LFRKIFPTTIHKSIIFVWHRKTLTKRYRGRQLFYEYGRKLQRWETKAGGKRRERGLPSVSRGDCTPACPWLFQGPHTKWQLLA